MPDNSFFMRKPNVYEIDAFSWFVYTESQTLIKLIYKQTNNES
jgi:hypothetical protein